MHSLVTGGAGFIGSHLAEALAGRKGNSVTVVDDLSNGKREFLTSLESHEGFKFVRKDVSRQGALDGLLEDAQAVFHLASAVEVRQAFQRPQGTFDSNILGTYRILESVRESGVKHFVFTSSGTVFGEATAIPTPESYGPMEPISLYGASKLACEAMISAYAHLYGFNAVVYRFANIIGDRGTHGVIRDFILKLRANPKELEILGNGKQEKSYLHVEDCVKALLTFEKTEKPFDVLHVGSDDSTSVDEIARIIVGEMGLDGVKFNYTGGQRGWPGDVARTRLDVTKLKKLGWTPHTNSSGAVRKTVRQMLKEI